jgi:uncharacterized protein
MHTSISQILILGSLLVLAGCASGPSRADLDELRQKAIAGDPIAQRRLGLANDLVPVGRQNYAEAARWYQLAADQGDALAQNNLASLYEHGLGVPTNFTRAAELYRKSADQGFAKAQTSLGRMYDLGLGVATNAVEANSWYLRATERGDPDAMFNLGVNYGFGLGVPKDRVQAFMWLDLARFYTQFGADRKRKWMIRGALDDLKKLLTPEQIREGETRARQWHADHVKDRK